MELLRTGPGNDAVVARPSVAELIERARAMAPLLRASAKQTESDRRVSAQTMALLADAGLLQLMKPKRFGGYEYGPSVMLRVGFELGRGCGSTAWCAMIANCDAWIASYWSLQAQQDVWGEDENVLIAATIAPTGACEAVDGGYMISGRWPFASNCENSQWCSVSCLIKTEEGPPGVGWFLTPAASLKIDQESWRMAGLQGTGSKTLFTDEPVFVPAHRMVRFSDIQAGIMPGASIPGNIMAKFAFPTFGAVALVSELLGMAQGALDWFCETMPTKKRVAHGPPTTAAQSPFVQERAGRASAMIDSAVALLLSDLEDAETTIFAGETLDTDQRVNIRRDIAFAARQSVGAVNLLFDGSGATAADLDTPIQRYWRDVNAGTHHVSLDAQAVYALAGQRLLGLAPVGSF